MYPWTWGCGPQLEYGDPVLNEVDSLVWVTTVPVALYISLFGKAYLHATRWNRYRLVVQQERLRND